MVVPGMFDMPTVMAESGYTEDDVFNLGLETDGLVFMVVVPELGACRVPDVALSHFMAGADEYTTDAMPEHWSKQPSGPWTIKRDRLRVLADSWEKQLDRIDRIQAALDTAHVETDGNSDLRGLSQYSIDEEGGTTTFCATQEEYATIVADKQAAREERHKRGHYTMHEAAEVLAAANSIGGADTFLKNRMRPAVESGALVLLDPIDGGPVTGRLCRPYDDWVTPKAIDEWLAGAKFDYRWPVAGAATQAAPAKSPASPVTVVAEIDLTMVATREELIEAFGKFTGMDKSWFVNLTDTPRLMAARKFTGQGGRNSAEPLFCPYEVMQWLADPKRKKGKPLSDTTAWRLLKNKFAKVYNQYSIGDPNAD